MIKRKSYPDDLSDLEWNLLEPLTINTNTRSGRRPKYGKREMLNAIFYLLRTGCSWRNLPHDFPPWKTVYTQFRTWKSTDFFEKTNTLVRNKLRKLLGRKKSPTAGIVDSQSVKTTEKGGMKGYDGAKKVKGRKRHIVVDTEGFLLQAAVTAANTNDRDGLESLIKKLKLSPQKVKKNLG